MIFKIKIFLAYFLYVFYVHYKIRIRQEAFMLELKNIEKQYADKLLFKNLNFTIYDGERVGIVGNNGSGKTTLMKIIAGEESPDAGSVYNSSASIGYLKQVTEYTKEDFLALAEDAVFVKEFMAYKKKLHITANIDFSIERLSTLSGGEKPKLMLAHILSHNPDVLLLDEPTNHMDAEGIDWLINALNEYNGTIITVSHDRYFLNSVVSRIIEIDYGKVNDYYGDYDEYARQKKAELDRQKKLHGEQVALEKKLDKQIKDLRSWAGKAEKDSRRQGGMMSDSRIKGAETRAQVSATKLASMAKAKASRLEQAKSSFVDAPHEDRKIYYELKPENIGSKVLIRAENLTKNFGDHVLFKNASFNIEAGEKVAIVGRNGCGKTTLIRMILGLDEEYSGLIWKTPSLKPTYLSQDVLDLDEDLTVMEMSMAKDREYRTKFLTNLANMNMSNQVFNRKIKTLSLGERMRIKMNEVILSDFNLLILDEPTNHLDLSNKIFMEKILADYEGALILVSHDRAFRENICTAELNFVDGTVKKNILTNSLTK